MRGVQWLKPSKNSRYKQGEFDAYNPRKYIGKKRPIFYRSSWELKFMIKMEYNPVVIGWSSEEITIPYYMKEKIGHKFVLKKHEYTPDFCVVLDSGKKYVIEVKPVNQIPKDKNEILRDPVQYKNACKWRAAKKYCDMLGYEFKVVNEEHLLTRIF